MLEIILITILNLCFAAWLKNDEFYPNRKIYKVLSLIPPLAILYGTILFVVILVMWLIETIKEILE
jgi:hypothetical protein